MTSYTWYGIKVSAVSISHWGLFRCRTQFWDRTKEEVERLFPDWDFK